MSGLFLLLCVIGMAIQGAFIVVERKEKFKLALVLKTTASVVFILAGLHCMQRCDDSTRAGLVVAGLILGGVGDFFLNLQFVVKKEMAQKIFLVGAVAFLAGHVLYIVSLIPYVKNVLLVSLLIAAVFTGVTMSWVYSRTVVTFGLKIFGLVYIGAVALLAVAGMARYIVQPVSIASLIFSIGAVLFTVSDIVLIFYMFGEKKPWMRTANLLFYYSAQLVIASSMLFVM